MQIGKFLLFQVGRAFQSKIPKAEIWGQRLPDLLHENEDRMHIKAIKFQNGPKIM